MSSLGLRRGLGAALGLGLIAAAALAAWAPAGARSHAAAPAAALVLLGMAVPRPRRARPADGDMLLEDSRYHALFDNTPVQILEEDLTAVEKALARLRAEGVTNLMAHLAAHPELPRKWLRLVRLKDANRPAVSAAGFADKKEMIARFPQTADAPYLEVFDYQLERLWGGRRLFEEEFRYLDGHGQERACLMLCRIAERDGQPDQSRVVLVLLDITTARRTVEAQVETQEVLRQILARANILIWWAQVRREGASIRWKINVPSQSFDSPLYQLATAIDRGGLWDIEHAPDLPTTTARSERALLDGSPGYQQEFRVLSGKGATHWLSEDVIISRLGADEWNLVGVITDVTARREAEEARRKTQAQLEQILGRTDCMLWQARVTETEGQFLWDLEAPPSGLQRRIFDSEVGIAREGVTGDNTRSLYQGFTMPDHPEMDARSIAALRAGAPAYEQEFRLIKGSQTFWLHERVSITPVGPGQWDLTGISIDVTERHVAEEARLASEALLHQMLTQADCLLWQAEVVRVDGELQWGECEIPPSGLYTRLFGGTDPSKTRWLWTAANAPDLPAMMARSRRAIRAGAPGYEQEFRVELSGHAFWLHERVAIAASGSDRWRLSGVIVDVTAQHVAEEARKASEAQLYEILERADCLLWRARVTVDGDEVRWPDFDMPPSGLSARLFGAQDISAEGRLKLWSLLNVPELPEMNERNRQALLSGAPDYEQDFRVVKPEGTIWLHEHVSITPAEPNEWRLVGVITDVTARREAEEAWKKSQAQLQEILNRADCILWQANVMRDGDGVRWRNFEMPSSVLYQRLFGADHPASGTGLWLPADTPELPEMNRRSTEAILSGAPGYEQEFPVLRSEKALWLHEQVSITALGPDEWNLVGVLMDVTARREAEEARKRSEAQLEQILERADCMIWQARVVRVGDEFQWGQFRVPDSPLHRVIFGTEHHTTADELWSLVDVPELPEMNRRSTAALRSGAPGYEQEFRVVRPDRTLWLLERVSITRTGPDEWAAVGMFIDVTARREAEEARKRSEAQLQQILSRADCMLWQARVTEVDNRMNWQFSAAPSGLQHRIFGAEGAIQREGVNGDLTNDLYIGLERPERAETEARCTAALHGGAPGYEQEFRLIKDGQTLWLHEQVSITPIGPGEWELGGITIDVTARREAERARRESEEQLHQLLTQADCLLWQARVVENAAGVLDWQLYIPRSSLYRELFGADPEEHPNLMWSELSVPELAAMNVRATDAIRRGEPTYEQEFRARREDRWYWLHEQVSLTRMGPREWNLVGVITDISARRAAELALAAEKERLAVTLRAMTEGVITTDTEGVVQFVNRAAAELVGCDETDVVRRPLGEICDLRDGRGSGASAVPFAQVLQADNMSNLPPHTRLVSRDGAERRVEGCYVPIHAADSSLIGTVLVFRDVTERERLEEEIARASKLESVGILAGGIAHDFNNILTAIMGNVTLALLDAGELAKVEHYLRETERAALRARDLTQQLLTFAKGGEPIRAAIRLPEVIREVAEFALHGSRVKCEYDFPADLWPADADKGQISQVVQNLVINAVQAMPEGGIVRIRARNETPSGLSQPPFRAGDYVHISVADTGTGIKAEHLAKVFDPYFTTKQKGSGLGLATVYSIVKRHEGHVEVESELGRGATFHLWLPALRESPPDLPAHPAAAAGSMQGRVLLMDDEEPIREMARFLLNRLGFEAELAADGAEAVRMYQTAQSGGQPFDLVIMDLTVPAGMGGQEALERLRQINPDVKAIVSSGYSSDPVLANYRSHGFRGMVAKPYQLDDLTRALREALTGAPATRSRPPAG
jgi:PAS domain S-box-containing protein